MGVVHRATDRLNGQVVALKRVLPQGIPAQPWPPKTTQTSLSRHRFSIALANEFKALASLRHPHIISVIEYGFDDQRAPYFTMEYLDDARPLLEASHNAPVETRVRYLLELLQALAYLHRHGILHRDLKPANVVVSGQQVKVLDFGLAAIFETATEPVGTLMYMAPEVIEGGALSEAADLFVVGILAHQVLTGRHPFQAATPEEFFLALLNNPVALDDFPPEAPLGEVVKKLLSRRPDQRYQRADQCLKDIYHCLGWHLPPESPEILESHLQAARFVGRQAEMDRLMTALERALDGRGSAILVGGESGVGKSRLLQEVRSRAMVRGMQVLNGQGVSESGGYPFLFWRAPLQRLLLTTPVSDRSAGVLREILPDIDTIRGAASQPPPVLEPLAARQRLLSEIAGVFKAQERPTLLILEDLQWAVESLEALRWLVRQVANMPLVIVGSYRDDEAPNLPAQLVGMEILRLGRLTAAEISELSTSMLGEAGKQPDVVQHLQQQTEGNVFFLVEVVRSLAQNAGRISAIDLAGVSDSLIPSGVQALIQRRLAYVPPEDQDLLKVAAVAGRQLNLGLLSAVLLARGNHPANLDRWLAQCADAFVLEVHEGRWRFVHDKLREGLLANVGEQELLTLHRLVAQTLEKLDEPLADRAPSLVFHWHKVGDRTKEFHYAMLAARFAVSSLANHDALYYYRRAYDLLPEGAPEAQAASHAHLLQQIITYAGLLANHDEQRFALETYSDLAQSLGAEATCEAALLWAGYHYKTGSYPEALKQAAGAFSTAQQASLPVFGARSLLQRADVLLEQAKNDEALACYLDALPVFQAHSLKAFEAQALSGIGEVYYTQMKYAEARQSWETAVEIYRMAGIRQGEAESLRKIGKLLTILGKNEESKPYYLQSLRLNRQIGDRFGEALCTNNLGIVIEYQGDYAAALEYFRQSLAIFQETDNPQWESRLLGNIAILFVRVGNYTEAQVYSNLSSSISQRIGDPNGVLLGLRIKSEIAYFEDRYGEALKYNQEARQLSLQLRNPDYHVDLEHHAGLIYMAAGILERAEQKFLKVLAERKAHNQPHRFVEDLACLAQIALVRDEPEKAFGYCEEALEIVAQNPLLAGSEEPFDVRLACYQVLDRLGKTDQAREFLFDSYNLLLEVAGRIQDKAMQTSYLNQVATHRALARAYKALTHA